MFAQIRNEQKESIKSNIAQYQNAVIDLDSLVDNLEIIRVMDKKIRKDEREYNRIISTYTVGA